MAWIGIEKFSHVQHIVSTVSGVLMDNLDCFDAFKSCFPAGTVSGAPKLRAMQIIEGEELHNRGVYAGAVGYVGFDRNLEFAIAISTVIVNNGRAHIQVGAGIVAVQYRKMNGKKPRSRLPQCSGLLNLQG